RKIIFKLTQSSAARILCNGFHAFSFQQSETLSPVDTSIRLDNANFAQDHSSEFYPSSFKNHDHAQRDHVIPSSFILSPSSFNPPPPHHVSAKLPCATGSIPQLPESLLG